MNRMLLAAVATFAVGCSDACVEQCRLLAKFYEACASPLSERGYEFRCFESKEAIETQDMGGIAFCKNADELVQSCLWQGQVIKEVATSGEYAAMVEACSDDTEYRDILAARDCDGYYEKVVGE